MFLTHCPCVRSCLRVAELRWSLSAQVHVAVSLFGGGELIDWPLRGGGGGGGPQLSLPTGCEGHRCDRTNYRQEANAAHQPLVS